VTHPADTVARSLALAAEGRSATEVARLVGVPRPTIRDWIHGRVPKRSPPGGCATCGGVHDFACLPPAYVQLLGLYLGDGCLSPHRRDVYKLRITLDARYPQIADECQDAMEAVMPLSRVNRVDKRTWWELYSYSKSWPCLLPQHGPGRNAVNGVRRESDLRLAQGGRCAARLVRRSQAVARARYLPRFSGVPNT
jgi:hypothetical protein